MIVQFNRNFPPYNAGERAGFADAEGGRLMGAGIAQAVVSPQEIEAKEPAETSGSQPEPPTEPAVASPAAPTQKPAKPSSK